MSTESAKALYSRLITDEGFRAQLEKAVNDEERQQILQAAGYEFTPEEWKAASVTPQGELSEEQLETVAGGIAPLIYAAASLAIYAVNELTD
jgi:predicted ribosomally synthesized peptide with nif11-like leader